jgi:S1-C subfamily serine protease
MRALLFLVVAACGPAVAPKGTLDEDLPRSTAPVANTAPEAAPRPEAPLGKGVRTGTIDRAKLVAVLDGGPGAFLRQLEITPRMDGNRFVGWQLVQLLDRNGPLIGVDVVPGDVLLAVNGKPLSRPDQLQTVWDSLRTANTISAELWRGNAKLELQFAIEPAVAAH